LKIKSQKDFWAGLMFIVCGLAFAWGATTYSFGSSARPGPGYFPFGLGVLMAILGALVVFSALTIETDDGEPIGPWAFRPLLIIMGSVALFGFLLPRLGMLISLPILIVMCSLAGDEFHWKDAVISVVVLTLGSWLIFIKGLNLVIPVLPKFITG
jgi:Tripartite tricarboxylate transporter TctB family